MIQKLQLHMWGIRFIAFVLMLSALMVTWAQPSGQTRYLRFEPASGSCFDAVVYESSGEVTPLPTWLRESLDCGPASLSPDGQLLVYVNKATHNIEIHNFSVWEAFPVPLQYRFPCLESMNLYCEHPPSFTWSAQSDRLAVTLVHNLGAVTHPSKVLVVDVNVSDRTQVTNRRLFNIDVTLSCGNICFPIELALETHHLRYQTNSTLFYETGRRTMAWLELDPASNQ